MASRTDPDLAEIVKPALESFDHARYELAHRLGREQIKSAVGFDLRRDLTRFALEGLAQQDSITFEKERRTEEVMGFLKALYDTDFSDELVRRAKQLADQKLGS